MTKDDDGLLLKIISGRLSGSSTSLEPGAALYVGRGLRNDIVLRDPSVRDARLKIAMDGPFADVDILQGEVELLGQRIASPATLALPPFTPMWLGDAALAYGDAADSDQWARCEALAAKRTAHLVGEGQSDPWAGVRGWAAALRRKARSGGLLGRRGMVILGAVLVMLGVVEIGGFGFAASWAAEASKTRRLDALLAQPAYAGLAQETALDGRLLISGFLPTDAERAQLEDTIQALQIDGVLDVATGEGLAGAVEEVFRLNGVTVLAEAEGARHVRVTGAVASPERLRELRTLVENDVPGLEGLTINYSLPEEPADAPADDPAKRVATVVGGPNGYVVTEDGSRYFIGATLPTGHRIVSLGNGEILVERDGARTAYQF